MTEQNDGAVYSCTKKVPCQFKAIKWVDTEDCYRRLRELLEKDCNRPGGQFVNATRSPNGDFIFFVTLYETEVTNFYSAQAQMCITVPRNCYLVYEVEAHTRRAINPVVMSEDTFKTAYNIIGEVDLQGDIVHNTFTYDVENTYTIGKKAYAIQWTGNNEQACLEFYSKHYLKNFNMVKELNSTYAQTLMEQAQYWLKNPYNKGYFLYLEAGSTQIKLIEPTAFLSMYSFHCQGCEEDILKRNNGEQK